MKDEQKKTNFSFWKASNMKIMWGWNENQKPPLSETFFKWSLPVAFFLLSRGSVLLFMTLNLKLNSSEEKKSRKSVRSFFFSKVHQKRPKLSRRVRNWLLGFQSRKLPRSFVCLSFFTWGCHKSSKLPTSIKAQKRFFVLWFFKVFIFNAKLSEQVKLKPAL